MANRREQIFVGRQREMAELKDALDDAMAGRGRSVMLAGEPGIGKTRTAQEVGSHATALGFKVLWGWCSEWEGAPPYWPWLQPLRSYIQEKDSAELRSQMGAGATDIAQIVPEVRQQLPDLEPSTMLDPEQARFRLFDAITNFLKNASQSQPLLLVLEDLHWADHSSLMLWEFVSKEISNAWVMLLGTYHDVEVGRGHPLSQALGSLIHQPSFRRVQLGGLSKQDAGRLVLLSTGVTLAEPSLDLIHSRTDGNAAYPVPQNRRDDHRLQC